MEARIAGIIKAAASALVMDSKDAHLAQTHYQHNSCICGSVAADTSSTGIKHIITGRGLMSKA